MSTPLPPVSSEGESRAEILFFKLMGLPPERRDAELDAACGPDAALRAEVEALFRDHERAAGFLHTRAAAVAPELEAEFARLKPEEPGDRIGNYKLLEQIGEGGFGVVWVAEQERPVRRRVALKIIKLGMDTKEVVARFEQERQALALMDHPNIAKVLDAGATPTGRPFFVMELVRGVKITDYCDQAQLSTAERLRLFIPVCQAVQHAHLKGIIHRDLKPSNILVTLHDGVPVPKVIDFGIAKATQQQRLTDLTIYTQFEQMIGTPLYMAPEQAEMSGLDVDTRSDVYSLGVLLYELLTGRTPFDPEQLMSAGYDEIRRVIREEEPPKPSTFVSTLAVERRATVAKHRNAESAKLISTIRGDLDWIVMKALEKDRNRRYESASSFAQDIERHLGSEPVQARPPSRVYRLRRFARRNRGGVAAAAAVAVALAVGLGGMVWQAVRANEALSELRATAPTFASEARMLLAKERPEEALVKLDYAIKLRPDVPEYYLAKADLLEGQLRFAEAAPVYRQALHLAPADTRGQRHAALAEKLAAELTAQPKLSRESLLELYRAMKEENRAPVEMIRVATLVGEEKDLLVAYWSERLREVPLPPDRPIQERLTVCDCGKLHLDLSGSDLANLAVLEGMPLEKLNLSGCQNVTDLEPLRGMPLTELRLGWMESESQRPRNQRRRRPARVTDLSPLQNMPLHSLYLDGTSVTDLSPLRGMPLKTLDVQETRVSDLNPLAALPLTYLDCTNTPARDFTPLAQLPLKSLGLQFTAVGDLSFVKQMPLITLMLNGANQARGYETLMEVETLKTLILPEGYLDLPEAELEAVAALRAHPSLERIDHASVAGGSPRTARSKADFFSEYDRRSALEAAALQLAGGDTNRFKKNGATWTLNLDNLPVSDLSSIAGAPLTRLMITNTKVSDLSPLRGMPLERFWGTGAPIRDVTPLAELPLVTLFLDRCPPGLDLSPLSKVRTLRGLLLPREARNVEALRGLPNLQHLSDEADLGSSNRFAQTAEQFWAGQRPATPETLAREGKLLEAETLLRERVQTTNSIPHWQALAALALARKDEESFTAIIKDMLDHLLGRGDSDVVAKMCLMSPRAVVPPEVVAIWMQTVRFKVEKPAAANWYLMSEGLRQFRAGEPQRALEQLKVIDAFPFPAAKATCDVIAAMAHRQLGQNEAATALLASAREAIDAEWPAPTVRNTHWHDWLIAHLLLQEAESYTATPP